MDEQPPLTISPLLQTRRLRQQRRTPRPLLLLGVGVAVLVIAAAFFVLATDDGLPRSSSASHAQATPPYSAPVLRAMPHPTPAVAEYRGRLVYLPVRPTDVTAVGFHQASGGKAYPLQSLCPNSPMTTIASAHRDAVKSARVAASLWTSATADAPTYSSSVWAGHVLRMWRSRPGKPDTAFDCGAPFGSLVVAPMDGIVTQVKPYKLYGKYPDFEIHISLDGLPGVDGVLIHVTDVQVAVGDSLVGGLTPIGHVRRLSDRLTTQLSTYTKEAGDHVHFQLNKPLKKGETSSSNDGS